MNKQALNARAAVLLCCMAAGAVTITGCASTADGNRTGSAAAADRECRTTGAAGTKLKRSVCMTAEEWAIADARGQEQEDLRNEYFRRVRESATLGSGPEFDSATGF